MTSHGMSDSPTYSSWANMRSRCLNPRNPKYKSYGGKGITVCQRWNSFEDFLADMGVKPDGYSIDRIDGEKGYEPGNCRWVDMATNRATRRAQLKLATIANKITIYVPEDIEEELEAIRATRRPIPSMNAIINEIIWEGLPTTAQVIIRRSRRDQTKQEDLRDD